MENKVEKLLFDIHSSICNIENYIGTPKLYENYEKDSMLQDAVERNIEIIGEAMNRIIKTFPEIKISNARRIVDTRNKIIHGYDEIENVIIWGIVIKQLPVLKQEVENYLKK